MNSPLRFAFFAGALLFLPAALTGCAGGKKGSVQFEPIPVSELGERELDPQQQQTLRESLVAANREFEASNAAQERGDHEGSLKHYTQMLELLLDADIDPTVFYSLRKEMGSIEDAKADEALKRARGMQYTYDREALEYTKLGDLEFPPAMEERVQEEVRKIQRGYARNFTAGLSRSRRYVPYIQREFERAGLPADLVWLAMVESQFSPKIDSRVGAGGMWQFMRPTGRNYGLRADSEVDDRYDWKKSTKAAIQYLSYLYQMFEGSWPLAVTAYNRGEYGMLRAIEASGGERDLAKLISTPPASNHIPEEAKQFYAKFLASVIVARDPGSHGISAPETPIEETTDLVVRGGHRLRDLERDAGLARGALAALNPQYLRGVTPAQGDSMVTVPAAAREQIASALSKGPQSPVLLARSHVVKRGDTPSGIAQKYKVSMNDLMKANNLGSARSLRVGQRLTLPGIEDEEGVGGPEEIVAAAVAEPAPPAKRATYTVRRGDTLTRIAGLHDMSLDELRGLNGLGRRTVLHVGDTLEVQGAPGVQVAAKEPRPGDGETKLHTVKKGEYPGLIASKYQVPLPDLLAWNGLDATSTLHVGDRLKVYGNGEAGEAHDGGADAGTTAGKSTVYVVVPGDTAGTIAQRHGVRVADFAKWNGLGPKSVIKVGQKLEIRSGGNGAKAKPGKADAADSDNGKRIEHTVAKNQNPTTIAARYGVAVNDLFEWNGWSKAPVLKVGDKVVVYGK